MSKPELSNIEQDIRRVEKSALDRVNNGQVADALLEVEALENNLRSDPSFSDVQQKIESIRRKINSAIDQKSVQSGSVVEVATQDKVLITSQKRDVESPIISVAQYKIIAEIIEVQKEVKKSLEAVLAKTGSKIWDENGDEIILQKVDKKAEITAVEVEIAAAKVEIAKQKKIENIGAEVEIIRPEKIEDVAAEAEVKKPTKDTVMYVEPQNKAVLDDHLADVREFYKKIASLGFDVKEKQVRVDGAGSEVADNILNFFAVAMPKGHSHPINMNANQLANALSDLLEAKKNPHQHHEHEIYAGTYGCGLSKEKLFDFHNSYKEEFFKDLDFKKSSRDKSFRDKIMDSREASSVSSSTRGY